MVRTSSNQGSRKTECGYLNGWIKQTVTYAKISPKMVNPRLTAENAKEEKEEQQGKGAEGGGGGGGGGGGESEPTNICGPQQYELPR